MTIPVQQLLSDLWPALSAIGGTIGGLLWLRRKTSKDGVEIVKDRAEVDVIKFLQDQRDQAVKDRLLMDERYREAEKERFEAKQEVLKMSNEIVNLVSHLNILQEKIESLEAMLSDTRLQLTEYIEENARLLGQLEVYTSTHH